MKFAPLEVNILQHEIFTPVHLGKYIMALNFHHLGWGKNITASNIDPIPLVFTPPMAVRRLYHKIFTHYRGENILLSNIHFFSWDENANVLDLCPFCMIIRK